MIILSQASALNPGSDLWIIPELQNSKWTRYLNWYLNMQVIKWANYKPQILSENILQTLKHCEIPLLKTQIANPPPMMISSENLLPNKWTIKFPYYEEWVPSIYNIWKELNHPSFRVFLPQKMTAQEFQISWTKVSSHEDYTLVLD